MALWRAGVEFNDNRVTGDDWVALKGSGKLPYGQVPALELADGTVLAQGGTIVNYIGDVYPDKLKHADPLVNAKADIVRKAAALGVNINAAKGLQEVLKTNLGPKGTLKM